MYSGVNMYRNKVVLTIITALILFLASCSGASYSQPESQSHPVNKSTTILTDKDRIFNYINSGENDNSSCYDIIRGDHNFVCTETRPLYEDYGAKFYECKWNNDKEEYPYKFIIKNENVYGVIGWDESEKTYETDFDHDGKKELIYYINFGSGRSFDTYYVIEKGDGPVYIGTFLSVWPKGAEKNGDYIVEAQTTSGDEWVEARLLYQYKDGEKTVGIDAGKYQGKLVTNNE
jgi:hypothetical protein